MIPLMRHADGSARDFYADLRSEVLFQARTLQQCRSTRQLHSDPRYSEIARLLQDVLARPHVADFRSTDAPVRNRYRVVAWNIERGTHLDSQIRLFRTDPYLRSTDVILITEADAGMARSGNRMVAETLARELGMAQVFAPCYFALGKGSGVEREVDGENEFGLHGNALLSRYPIRDIRVVPLNNGVDKLAHREKRVGRQAAIVARIDFPGFPVEAASVHLDAQSTQRHRRDQMAHVLRELDPALPAIVGGDWNTSTYNSSHAFWAICGFWLRVMMGVDYVIRDHYLHPGRLFERGLFRLLERNGFDYRNCNIPGEGTTCYDINDIRATRNLGEWVPGWCFAFIRWALRNHAGRCPLKLDWFATRGLRATDPAILHGLRLSDHDPIGVDVIPSDR